MAQSLSVPGDNDTLLRVEIIPQRAAGNADAVMRIRFPHGVALNSLIGIQVDSGQLFKFPLQISDSSGVYATWPIGSDFIDSMRAGRKVDISFILSTGQLATVSLSLFGFSAANDMFSKIQGETLSNR